MPTAAQPAPSVREAVFRLLMGGPGEPRFLQARLEREWRFPAAPVSEADRRLCTEIACGVVRRKRTLDALLSQAVRRPWKQVEPALQTLLRMGAYQLLLLDSVPAHAAVNETVAVCERVGSPQWTGFANAALRRLARERTDEIVEEPGPSCVPLHRSGAAGGVYRRLTEFRLPDPAQDFLGYFAVAFSFPDELARRWGSRYSPEDLLQLGFWFNESPRTTLRVRPPPDDAPPGDPVADYLACLAEAGLAAEPGSVPMSVRLLAHRAVTSLPGWEEGAVSVQDETAMHAARWLAPRPGERILDLCSAPGGKTTQLAELAGDRAEIVAADLEADRLALVGQACRRLRLASVRMVPLAGGAAAKPLEEWRASFDAVLADVPCSNTGVLGKRVEARWRFHSAELRNLARQQTRLLEQAAALVRPGGRMVYSTCSIEPEENGEVVRAVLERIPTLRLQREETFFPGRPADGGYAALLTKETDVQNSG